GLTKRLSEELDQQLTAEILERVKTVVEPQTWDAFRLHIIERRSSAEVASVLGVTPKAVHSAVYRVWQRIHSEFDELDDVVKDPGTSAAPLPGGVPWDPLEAERLPFEEQSPIEIYIDPGDASKETIRAVLESLSDLHRAAGGLGLEFTSDGNFILSAEEVIR